MSLEIPARTDKGAKTLVPGLNIEWLADGNIVAFTLTSSAHNVIEAYYKINWALMDEADKTPERLMVMLHDISDKNMVLTPMLRSRLDEIAQRIKTGQVQYRSAVVMSNSPMSRIFMFFGNVFSSKAKNTIQRFFTNREQGLQWLEQYVPAKTKS